jgi:hypothetical protein
MINGFLADGPRGWPAGPRGTAPVEADAPEELVEMANLPRRDTGVEGIIYISTAQGSHGPRVKWFPDRPSRDAPCLTVTLEAEPRAINHGLPSRQAQAAEAQVKEWVALNRDALLEFWQHGVSWTRDEVNAFIDGLAKLP